MADVSDLASLKMDAKTTLKATDIRIHDFSFAPGRKSASSGHDAVDRTARAARQSTQAAASIKIGGFDVDFGSLRVDLGDEGPEGAPLREAKALIQEQKFDAALAKLEAVLTHVPQHHEAIYLQAFCRFKLREIKKALDILLSIKEFVLTNRLQTRIRSLREEIRQTTIPEAQKVYDAAVKGGEPSKGCERLKIFAESDPAVGRFHILLVECCLKAKRIAAARAAAVRGLDECETEREELEQLRNDIDESQIPELLQPARAQFRAKKYADALKSLDALSNDWNTVPLWKCFHGYVKRLAGGGGGLFSFGKPGKMKIGPADDAPGTHDEMWALFDFLVDQEMANANIQFKAGRPAEAEKFLRAAIEYVPGYTLANHQLATCVYQRIGGEVKSKIGSDLDEEGARQLRRAKESLADARKYAAVAADDSEIIDGRRLLASIDEMQKQIDGVVEKFENQAHDAKLVNKAIDDFLQVLLGIFEVINASSWQKHNAAENLMRTLESTRNNLPNLRRQCRGEEARGIVDTIRNDIVEPQYQMLRQALGR